MLLLLALSSLAVSLVRHPHGLLEPFLAFPHPLTRAAGARRRRQLHSTNKTSAILLLGDAGRLCAELACMHDPSHQHDSESEHSGGCTGAPALSTCYTSR